MIRVFVASLTSLLLANAAAAQTGLTLSGPTHNTTQEVEVTADTLTVQQASNSAVFKGNAKVAQGDIRFGADEITVQYDPASNNVTDILAKGNVVFTNGTESAEAQTANFNVQSNIVLLSGNVLLLQGATALSGDRLRLDLATNQASVSGNVKTVFTPK